MNRTFKKEKKKNYLFKFKEGRKLGKKEVRKKRFTNLWIFSPKLLILIVINETNEKMTRKFRYLNVPLGQKVTNSNFLKTKKRLKILQGWISNISIFIRTKNIF